MAERRRTGLRGGVRGRTGPPGAVPGTSPGPGQPPDLLRTRVVVAGTPVPGDVRLGPLRRHVDVIEVREGGGGATRTLPGAPSVDPVVLARPLDADRTFETWAAAPVVERREVLLELLDAAGATTASFRLVGCWPSAYEALPTVPGGGTDAGDVLESITLQPAGWVRVL